MAKKRCACCKAANCLKLKCKFCENEYCTFCLLPEKHACTNLEDCATIAKQRLDTELYKNKCVAPKIKLI